MFCLTHDFKLQLRLSRNFFFLVFLEIGLYNPRTTIYYVIKIHHIYRKTIGICSLISLISLFKLLTTIAFIYQTIELTIDYLKYETVIDLKMIRIVDNRDIAITIYICVKPKQQIFKFNSGKNLNSTIIDYYRLKNDCSAAELSLIL